MLEVVLGFRGSRFLSARPLVLESVLEGGHARAQPRRFRLHTPTFQNSLGSISFGNAKNSHVDHASDPPIGVPQGQILLLRKSP